MIIGSIILFALPAAQIPAGWQVADGTNGTIDLRNRFAKGATGDAGLGFADGSNSQLHTFTSNAHNHSLQPPVPNVVAAGMGFDNLTDNKTVSGTTDIADNQPAYNTAYYIQKVS